MKTNIIEVIYESENKIFVIVNGKKTLILSNEKKQINASEIYKCLNYKKGEKYSLTELNNYKDINEDYKNYLIEIHEIFKSILKEI